MVVTESRAPFELGQGPMLRVQLWRLRAEEYVVLLTLHHIASDGWSMGLLIKEVMTLYAVYAQGAESPLPELPVQYSDFAVWQRGWLQGAELERQLAYWRGQLGGELPVLELPTDRPRSALEGHRGAHQQFRLGPEITTQLRELSRREGVTMFMTLLAAFQLLLQRYSGQKEIVVGTDVANRNYGETEGLIGFFVNQLVLRTDLSGEPRFVELLRRVKEVCLGAYAHQDVPFEKLVEELQPERDLSRSPLFQVKLVLQNVPQESLRLEGLQLARVGVEGETAKFDLMLTLVEGEGLNGVLEFNTDLFERERIERLLGHFEVLLQGIVAEPQRRLSELPLLGAEELATLRGWSERQQEYEARALVQEVFEAQAAQRPEAVAIVSGGKQLSFGELNGRANQLAYYLRAQGVGPEVVVGLYLERSVEMVVGLLGILKAGGAYVPLDPAYPRTRVEYMLADAQVQLVLTQGSLLERLPVLGLAIALDQEWETIAAESAENLEPVNEAENLAYVIYTSGSTGQPKGVMISHANVWQLLCGLQETVYAALGEGLRVGWNASLSFDPSVQQWLQLLNGHAIYLLSEEERVDAARVLTYVREHGVEVLDTTPGQVRTWLDAGLGSGAAGEQLAVLLVGGEAIDGQLWQALGELAQPLSYNVYGPAECTVDSTWSVVSGARPVLGQRLPQASVYVLDEQMQLAPVGVRGELCIGGGGVGRGYWQRAELTAERYVPHPFSTMRGERLYRTGDEGRYLADGRIEYLGRRDQQVKVRGYRIELGEIEAALESHAAVRQAVVLVREDQLVAYVVGAAESALGSEREIASELRPYLRAHLPEYMVPQRWVVLEQLPLTTNGKVDREALPAPSNVAEAVGEQGEWTPLEEIVAGIWSEVLKRDVAGREENFFELGGHSLLATQVISRVREVFGVEIALRRLFEEPTVRGLCASIDAALRAGAGVTLPELRRAEERGLSPLSFAQQRLWFLDQLEPGNAFYNLPLAVRLTGALNVTALEQTLTEIVRRHEVLRTRFVDVAGEPRQEVLPPVPVKLSVTEVYDEAWIRELVNAESNEPFDLATGPMLRVRLLRLGDDDHVVLLTMHHIASDGWSMGVLTKEVATLYATYSQGEESSLTELPVQYGDFAVWQRGWLQGEELERQLSYWRAQLRELPLLELPVDHARPSIQSYDGASVGFRLSAEVSAALKELSRREGVTLFMTLLAAFQALLSRYSGQRDIVVGTPIAGRTHHEIEPLIGFFVNTLVLRSRVNPNESFRELLGQVREVCLGAYAHQDVPFEKLVEELQPERDPSRSALFQAMFALQNASEGALELPGLRLSGVGSDNAISKFDLGADFSEDRQGQLRFKLTYVTRLFDQATMERMGQHLQRLLEAIAETADEKLGAVSILTEAEQAQLRDWAMAAPAEVPLQCVQELFEAQVARTPDAIAVVSGSKEITYRELNRRANRLAHYLRRRGMGADQLVGLCIDRSVEMLVGMLGTLKAGGAYVPLDPSYPRERLQYMLEHAGVQVLLTEQRLAGGLADTGVELVCLDTANLGGESEDNPGLAIEGANLAYVIYTSGSTGIPKGVMIEHAGLSNFATAIAAVYEISASDRVLQFASISFDTSAEEIYASLIRGACLVLRSDDMLSTPERFLRECGEQSITVLDLPTAYWHELVASGGAKQLPECIRFVVVGGEKARRELVRQWQAELNREVRLVNGYGPTEVTVVATTSEMVDATGREIKIGRPISNVEVYVLDEQLQPVPVGIAGELYIGGAGLARGYLGQPEETAKRFVPHPYSEREGERLYRSGDLVRYREDGELEYIGRRDEQVKLRGYRVELGEIETLLESHASVRQAVVTVRDERLVAYVVSESWLGNERELAAELRPYLRERLPEYMVPQRWVWLDQLPLTVSRKIDHDRLPAPVSERELEWEGEATAAEELVAGIWSEVLRLEAVGRDENFFDLGGHSLLATQVISRVRQVFGIEVGLRRLFEEPTVRGLSRSIEELLREGAGKVVPALQRAGDEERSGLLPLSFAQQRLWFLDQMEPGSASYNMPLAVRLTGALNVAALEQTLTEIVRRHEVLRTRFVNVDDEPRQEVLPPVPIKLSVTEVHDEACDS